MTAMNEHVFNELPALLKGDSSREQVLRAAAHLRECDDCRQELTSALIAHASLASSARFSPGVWDRGTLGLPSSETPPQAPPGAPSEAPSDAPRSAAEAEEPLPDLTSLFAAVREQARTGSVPVTPPADADDDSPDEPARRRRFSTPWLVAAAVVGLGLGGGAVVASQHVGRNATTDTVSLAAFNKGPPTSNATAKLTAGDQMEFDATSLPNPGGSDLYEVWLTNADRTKMHAVGWIDTDGKGEFTVPTELMGEYSAIEVSVQPVGGSYEYSGTSVLRGTY